MSWGVTGVTVVYGRHVALRDVSLLARPGAVHAVVGGDGAGKSTLLRTLVGALQPSVGTVRRPDPHDVGYVPEGPGVYADLTVEQNLAFAGAAYGITRAALAERAEGLLERTALAPARRRLGGELSGGMRQKLALAMALVHDPALLVLDEPTTGLDPVSRRELWRLVARSAASGTAIVLSTAYLDEAERAAHVLVLHDGEALAAGAPEDIVAAVPGAVVEQSTPDVPARSWRRGGGWRVWCPDGAVAPGAVPVEPDLEDALVVAALARADREVAA